VDGRDSISRPSKHYSLTATSWRKNAFFVAWPERKILQTLGKAEIADPSDAIAPEEAIRDPFILEFLGLKDEYSELDIEESLIQHLTEFLLELGDDFAFLGRQRRLRIDDTWFRIDLVFFHRRLRCPLIIRFKGW
jgi:predicted nuclease of restriction endonuclease-like (RecB) superfamily